MIAVTGAAGFIGSNLAHRLADEGRELLLVDHEFSAAKGANFVGLSRFAFSRHDHFLADLSADRVRPDAIFHLGACSSTTETSWDYLFRNNVEYVAFRLLSFLSGSQLHSTRSVTSGLPITIDGVVFAAGTPQYGSPQYTITDSAHGISITVCSALVCCV